MYRWIIGVLIVTALSVAAAEAQTITGRVEPVWDPELEMYTYAHDGSLRWNLEVAPSSARSDELSVNVYYNKRAAVMYMYVFCFGPERPTGYIHAWSYSGEHFVSLITGLFTGDTCSLTLTGLSDRNEVLSYRMAVSERVTRSTDLQGTSNAAGPGASSIDAALSAASPTVTQALRSMARAAANRVRESRVR